MDSRIAEFARGATEIHWKMLKNNLCYASEPALDIVSIETMPCDQELCAVWLQPLNVSVLNALSYVGLRWDETRSRVKQDKKFQEFKRVAYVLTRHCFRCIVCIHCELGFVSINLTVKIAPPFHSRFDLRRLDNLGVIICVSCRNACWNTGRDTVGRRHMWARWTRDSSLHDRRWEAERPFDQIAWTGRIATSFTCRVASGATSATGRNIWGWD